ncbi:MAG: hypothetical protein MI923_02735 [Phycisphaerales bacterium]|nr:hypothetical protein [Phycisphaerales bacterium]
MARKEKNGTWHENNDTRIAAYCLIFTARMGNISGRFCQAESKGTAAFISPSPFVRKVRDGSILFVPSCHHQENDAP